MHRILVLFTGGTIGSSSTADGINVNAQGSHSILDRLKRSDVDFESVQLMNVLSENMDCSHWQQLILAVRSHFNDGYSGIIVTHGSDTLAYSAVALGLCLADAPLPVVLVCSNYTLDSPKSNGIANFNSAIDFIIDAQCKGVYCTYQNRDGINCVYLGTRIIPADPYLDQFSSPYGEPLGTVQNGKYLHNAYQNPSLNELKTCQRTAFEPHFYSDLLYIEPYPGQNYYYNPLPRAALHGLYHSATANSDRLCAFAHKCRQNGTDLYIAPVRKGKSLYTSCEKIIQAGAIPITNTTAVTAYVKLSLGYGLFETGKQVQEFMEQNIFFERYNNI